MIKLKDILMEMPQLIDIEHFDSRLNDTGINISNSNSIVKSSTPISEYDKFSVYEFLSNNKICNFFIIPTQKDSSDRITIAATEFIKIKNGIRFVFAWRLQHYSNRGLVVDLYINYYLPKYGRIESDTLQTENGKELWKNIVLLCLKYPEKYLIYNNDNAIKSSSEIQNMSDFESAYILPTKSFINIGISLK